MAEGPTRPRSHRLLVWLIGRVAAPLFRLWFATCRVRVVNPEVEQFHFGQGVPGVGVTWHRGAIWFLYYYGKHRPAIMISASRDGDLLARYLEAMGGVPVRGSSSRGGISALKTLRDYLRDNPQRQAATVADGPTGPPRQAKPGMIQLAMLTGLPLYPLAWSADRAWELKSTWDRTLLPLPFARIQVAYGRPRSYPRRMDPTQLEEARQCLEDDLNRLQDAVDHACGR